jgi:hypothetical protein
MADLLTSWASFYANHAVVRTLVAFAHVGGLIAGGGLAVASDRAVLRAWRGDAAARGGALETLEETHRFVIAALAVVMCSGLLLFASDADTFLYSKFFWTKMGLVAALLVNGLLLWRSERSIRDGHQPAWRTLRFSAAASMTLWFLTTLGGVALPNIG